METRGKQVVSGEERYTCSQVRSGGNSKQLEGGMGEGRAAQGIESWCGCNSGPNEGKQH